MKRLATVFLSLTGWLSVPLLSFAVDSWDNANLFSTEVRLPLANGDKITARRIAGKDFGSGNFSWTGEVTGVKSGFVTLAKMDGWLSGTVHLPLGITYSFRGPTSQLQMHPATAKARPCGGCRARNGSTRDPRRQRRIRTWRNGDGNLVDLLVVYPPVVATEAGGASAVEADVAKAVADANLCYRNSQVNLQLRLVHLAEIGYTPTGVVATDLERLEGTADGYMDDVHALRDQYGADLVALLTTDSDSGGLAGTMMHPALSFASQGFSVSVWDQIGAPSYTLAHELGHNMGCLHNREDDDPTDSGESVFQAFSYGKRWISAGNGYATVMSYDTKPSTYPNTVPYFSNPNVSYLGTSTGNAGTEDNAQVLRFTAPYVANFRAASIQGIVTTSSAVTVKEGNSTSLNVRLAIKPASTITVTASLAAGGDADLILSGPTSLTFDSGNWSLPHPLQLFAKPDTDTSVGTTTLSLAAAGLPTTTVTVMERDTGTTAVSDNLVAGIVTNSLGAGISGATLTLSNSGGSVVTDANGTFRHLLPSGWSGILTPSKTGHTFATSTISALSADSTGHVFEGSRPDVLFVDADATGSGDGTSWADAYTDLNAALRSEHPFSEVWVAKGTYKPGTIRPAAFLLPPGIPMYGGFAGTEILRSERNSTAHPTILSGDLATEGDASDNAYHVVIPAEGSILDGFTIRDGNASENFANDDRGQGGALWADGVTFTMTNCTFTGNFAHQGGGAVYLKDATTTFSNCTFTNNVAGIGSNGVGGAINANNSTLTFSSCTFTSNVSKLEAGAINSLNSTLSLTNCSFTSNQNANANGGGAIYILGGSLTDVNGTYTNNSSATASSGGAIDANGSTLMLTGCLFRGNQSHLDGGAINSNSCILTLTNCSFTANQNLDANGGGAINIVGGSLTDINGTYTSNSCAPASGGGAIQWAGSEAFFTRTTFDSNKAPSYRGGAILATTGTLTFSNCSFQLNFSGARGGSVRGEGVKLIFNDTSFTSNQSSLNGGAISSESSTVSTIRCLFTSNQSTDGNGGGACHANGGSWVDANSTYTSNKATSSGGAFLWESATGSISDSNFTSNENTAWNGGGAIYLENASPTIKGCSFTSNVTKANNNGGAIHLSNASPIISTCAFTRNASQMNSGGAVFVDSNSLPVLSGNEFRYNSSNSYGGAMYLSGSQQVQVSNSLFLGNYADSGGAISAWGTTGLTFSNCRFLGNEANATSDSSGGMALLASGATGTEFVNCVFSGNKANHYSGVFKAEGATRFVNCSLAGNSAGDLGGITILFDGESVAFENCILWGNSATGSGKDVYVNTGTATHKNSLFEPAQTSGILTGSVPLSSDPLFTDADGPDNVAGTEDDDLTLQVGSPAIDQASTSVAGYSTTDLYGKVRSGAPDLGAYEYRTNSAPVIAQGTSATFSLDEDGSAVVTYSATDLDGDALTWSVLTQASHGTASVGVATGVVSYSPNPSYFGNDSFVLQVSDGTTTTQITVDVTVRTVNAAPVLTNAIDAGVLSVPAKDGNVTVVTLSATDREDHTVTFSLGDSQDENYFDLNETTGVLRFRSPPDYEVPVDTNKDNLYLLSVYYTDGIAPSSSVEIRVTVTPSGALPSTIYFNLTVQAQGSGAVSGAATYQQGDLVRISATPSSGHGFTHWMGDANGSKNPMTVAMDANKSITAIFVKLNAVPFLTNSLSDGNVSVDMYENQTEVLTLTADDDDDDPVTFARLGTYDADLFDLNATTGILSFLAPPDYESPADGGANNIYELEVTVSDGQTISSPTSVQITILDDKAEPPTHFTLTAIAQVGGMVTGEGTYPIYSADANATLLATANLGYAFSHWIGDSNGSANPLTIKMSANKSLAAVFIPLNAAPSLTNSTIDGVITVQVNENNSTVLFLTAVDEEHDPITYYLNEIGDHTLFDLNATTGLLTFKTAPNFEGATDANVDNLYEVSVYLSDGNASSPSTTVKISVIDLAENEWVFADDKGSGWRAFSWFGNYYETSAGWIYHEDHGWLYRTGETTASIWFYDPKLAAWLWTAASVYPYFYSDGTVEWLYYKQTSKNPRKFYGYANESWLEVY